MKKQNENLFRDKFRLLNSQDHTEDIKWSSSSSSESECTSFNDKVSKDRRRCRKRKRKTNVSKNVSNLDITFINSCKNEDSYGDIEKSPILKPRHVTNVSPVLTGLHFPPKRKPDTISPVLSTKRLCSKSPVLNLKTSSPQLLGSLRKKLCYEKDGYHKEKNIENANLSNKVNEIDTRLSSDITRNRTEVTDKHPCNGSQTNSSTTLNESNSSIKSNLMVKVKNFFDSHFSSEPTSQNISITDTTPSDCSKNEDVIILSCKTQTVTNLQSVKFESVSNSDTSNYDSNIKKVKYKRGGLAYRLNAVVKKQNAHISLWQHERFLANNSNFVLPKEENIAFRIQTFELKYGCYLLNAVDIDDKKYLILIIKKYMNTAIGEDSILKLYEPFQILSIDSDVKIIVNVCKFECVVIKK